MSHFRTPKDDNQDFFESSQKNSQDFFSSSQNASTFFSNYQNNYYSQFFSPSIQQNDFLQSTFNQTRDEIQAAESRQALDANKSIILFSDSDDESIDDSQIENVQKSPEDSQKTFLESLENIEESQSTQNDEFDESFSELPEAIVRIYRNVEGQYSDYTFTSIIAGQLCCEMFPFGAYNHLKLPLLMSLVSSTDKLHIMAIGRDTSHACMIMKYIGKFAQRFLHVTSNYDGITAINDKIEGGAIILASKGIGFLGNWQGIPQKSALKLLREIETSSILVDKIQKHYPLQTTIWAYWNFSSKVKKDLASIIQFINVFGIPITIDDQVFCEDIIDDLLNQVLTQPYDRTSEFHISENDFDLYINYVRNLTVEFDPRADQMLKNYFMATKVIRPDAISEKGYETLKIMAESHAKLSLRKTVKPQDALVSISIAEKFIKEFFDKDSFTSPSFSIESESIESYDKFMSDLYEWYSKFTTDILEKI